MDGVCSTHEKKDSCIQNLIERREYLGMDWNIILKSILKK